MSLRSALTVPGVRSAVAGGDSTGRHSELPLRSALTVPGVMCCSVVPVRSEKLGTMAWWIMNAILSETFYKVRVGEYKKHACRLKSSTKRVYWTPATEVSTHEHAERSARRS
jgi:hypothetical protein